MRGLVTVFGGSGFLGGQIVRALARRGRRVRVAVRNPGRGYRLRMLGDVGQIEVVQANLRDDASVGRALDGAEACVNAVGILFETGRQKFEAVHVDGARTVARACAARGIERLAQISAIGADAGSASRYAASKAAGEAAVREAVPTAVILRPSVIFGAEDHFFNRFAEMAMISPTLPLIGGGEGRMQPVFVADVAAATAATVGDAACAGRTYELGGPATYSFRELMQLMLAEIRRERLLVRVPFGVALGLGLIGEAAAAAAAGLIPPPITRDQVTMLRLDNVVAPGALTLADLGVAASALEPIIPTYLYRYRKGGQYADVTEAAAALPPR